MRIQTTAVLLGIVVVLGAIIWWTDRKPATVEDGEGGGNVMVRLDGETIGRITLERPGSVTALEKREGGWFLAGPIEDRADPQAVKALLDTLGHLTILDEISKDEIGSSDDLSLSALGLASDEVVRIELGQGGKGKDTRTVLVGNATPLANSIYARTPDSDEVFVVNGNPRKYLEDPVASLRDRSLIRTPADRVVQVVVKTPLGDIDIRRKITPPVADWTLMKPLQTRANRELLESILTGLASLQFEGVSDSGDLPGPLPNPIPDGSVALELYSFGEGTPLTILLQPGEAAPAGQVPVLDVQVSDRPAVFQVRSNLLASLPDSPDAFRDRHLARIPQGSVFGIGIQSRGHVPVILKTGETRDGTPKWFSVRNGKEELANAARVVGLIKAVNETEVLDFVSDSAARLDEFNLDPPAQKIAFSLYEVQPDTAPDGAPMPDAGELGIAKRILQLGSSDDGSALFANFAGEPYIYEIGPEFLQKFYGDPLRWKSLNVSNFNEFNLREIRRQVPGEPELKMLYDFRRDAWTVTQREEDLSDRLDRIRAAQLRDVLGSLNALDWTTSAEVSEVLQKPAITFTIRTEEFDRATGKTGPMERKLRFAPRAPGTGIFYGAIDDSPDLFQIDRDTFQDLIAPVLSRQAPADQR